MDRPKYLEKYLIDWELFDVIVGGKSALDASSFLGSISDRNSAENFLRHYGYSEDGPIEKAELYGNYQEALQFIKKYFLKENNPDGLALTIPYTFYVLTDVVELFLMAAGVLSSKTYEDRLWAGVILKVMHTIAHIDKDMRHRYFPVIQQQIFDQFYKNLKRDQSEKLSIDDEELNIKIPLVDFQTKSKKSRESIIMKLLHKAENVAEELFDRIGIRFITYKKSDALKLIKYLDEKHIVLPHNIKPSRSINTLIDLQQLKNKHRALIREAIKKRIPENEFEKLFENEINSVAFKDIENLKNSHSSKKYRAIQFTCRQLIRYKNPLGAQLVHIRNLVKELKKENKESPLNEAIMSLDLSHLESEVRFFYPFEVQIVDQEAHLENTQGEASHETYKKAQINAVIQRIFRPLLEYKNIST